MNYNKADQQNTEANLSSTSNMEDKDEEVNENLPTTCLCGIQETINEAYQNIKEDKVDEEVNLKPIYNYHVGYRYSSGKYVL